MAEYISRKTMRRTVLNYNPENPKKATCWAMMIADLLRDIDNLPAADVQTIKHGTWRKGEQGYDAYVECSECGLSLSTSNYIENEWRDILKYCPCCGARMGGDSE